MTTARSFTASLKPVWDTDKIEYFLVQMQGSAVVWIINHDMDDTEPHTHVLIEYETPRKLSTVSNLLEVADNFIEVVKNKKAVMRYLTHKDSPEKYQYHPSMVYTNSDIDYEMTMLGSNLTDKDIARYLQEGRGIELLGVVSSSKLRTIQSFLHFDNSNATLNEIREVRKQLNRVTEAIDNVETIATQFIRGVSVGAEELVGAMRQIAEEVKKARIKNIR